MSIRSRAPEVRMSSPLITVTTAGLSFSLVTANDATCVAAPLSSPDASELSSGSDGTGAGGCAIPVGDAEGSGPSCALALATVMLVRTSAAADHVVRSRRVIITAVFNAGSSPGEPESAGRGGPVPLFDAI